MQSTVEQNTECSHLQLIQLRVLNGHISFKNLGSDVHKNVICRLVGKLSLPTIFSFPQINSRNNYFPDTKYFLYVDAALPIYALFINSSSHDYCILCLQKSLAPKACVIRFEAF